MKVKTIRYTDNIFDINNENLHDQINNTATGGTLQTYCSPGLILL